MSTTNYPSARPILGPDGKPYVAINLKDLSTGTGISEENLKAMVQE